MELFVTVLVSGLVLGITYGLVASTFALLYRGTHLLNLFVGELVTVGALVGFTLVSDFDVPVLVALPVVVVMGGLLNLLLYMGPIRLMRNPIPLRVVVLTFGVSLILRGLAEKKWGTEIYSLPEFPGVSRTISVIYDRAVISGQSFYLLALLAIVVVGIWFFETRTRLGWSLRAVGINIEMAQSFGVRTSVIFGVAFAMSGALASLIGFLLLPVMFMTTHSGMLIGLKGLTAAVVGGISGRSSVIAGGLVIGLLEQSVAAYLGSGWQDLAVFAALIIVLVLRPSGLFASRSPG